MTFSFNIEVDKNKTYDFGSQTITRGLGWPQKNVAGCILLSWINECEKDPSSQLTCLNE